MAMESTVPKPPPPVLNVSLPITASVFACAVLLTVVVVTTIRKRRERRRTFLITPYCFASPSSNVTHTTQIRQRSSTSASETVSRTSVATSKRSQSSMCKSPTTAVIEIQNSIPPSFGTLVDTTVTLPEHPPLLKTRTTSNHRQQRKLCTADMDVKEKIMMTMYGFGQDRTSFLPRYQVRPDFESDPLLSASHHPPPAYQV